MLSWKPKKALRLNERAPALIATPRLTIEYIEHEKRSAKRKRELSQKAHRLPPTEKLTLTNEEEKKEEDFFLSKKRKKGEGWRPGGIGAPF